MAFEKLKIGLLGFGNIGTGVIKSIQSNGDVIQQRTGCDFEISKIADLDIETDRGVEVDKSILTTNSDDLFNDPEINVVLELIGGVEPARTLVEKALKAGKHVVTANKALLATHFVDLLQTADENNVQLLYEASVGGSIPCMRSMQQGLSANQFSLVAGILNGTCNYILTQMISEGWDFNEALDKAKEYGYAEPDPTFDIEGIDTAHKLALLASLAFNANISLDDVYCEGITKIQSIDIAHAATQGYGVKLLGISKQHDDGRVEVRVHPTMIPIQSALATVRGVFNAVMTESNLVGSTLLYGRGAGPLPTAAAILNDLIAIAIDGDQISGRDQILKPNPENKNVVPIEEIETCYYLRLSPLDSVTAGSMIATELASEGIRFKSFQQVTEDDGENTDILVITEQAVEKNILAALKKLNGSKKLSQEPFFMRIEDELIGNQ